MKREREGRHRPWTIFPVFCCSSNVLVCWFYLHSCVPGVRSIFGAHSKIGAATFHYFHIVLVSAYSHLYHVMSPSLLTWVVPLFPPFIGGRTYLFLVVPHLHRRFWTSWVFFLSILITIVIHSWLADLQPVLWLEWARPAAHSIESLFAFCSSFFLLSLLPQKFSL